MFICSGVSMLWKLRFVGSRRALKSLVMGLVSIAAVLLP